MICVLDRPPPTWNAHASNAAPSSVRLTRSVLNAVPTYPINRRLPGLPVRRAAWERRRPRVLPERRNPRRLLVHRRSRGVGRRVRRLGATHAPTPAGACRDKGPARSRDEPCVKRATRTPVTRQSDSPTTCRPAGWQSGNRQPSGQQRGHQRARSPLNFRDAHRRKGRATPASSARSSLYRYAPDGNSPYSAR